MASIVKLTLAACLESYRPRKDKSFTLTFSTSELREYEIITINQLMSKIGALHFTESDKIEDEDLAKMDVIDKEINNKSQSTRLRNTLFVLHQQNGGNNASFKDFYTTETEKIINHYKSKLG
jgi:hypothetical protein